MAFKRISFTQNLGCFYQPKLDFLSDQKTRRLYMENYIQKLQKKFDCELNIFLPISTQVSLKNAVLRKTPLKINYRGD